MQDETFERERPYREQYPMRTRLLHPLAERRHSRRQRRAPSAPVAAPSASVAEAVVVRAACDPAVQRVRAAGGPLDTASYACQCGCLFNAHVSTTVACPHCGADQAW